MNEIAQFAFTLAGVSMVAILALRTRRLKIAQRNAVAAGVFGLFLCAKHAAVIDSIANWIFVFGCVGMFAVLCLTNLKVVKLTRD